MFYPEERFFKPKRTDTLVERVLPFVNTWVTVQSWHENIAMKKTHPDDKLVGHVEEFCADIPESELLVREP